MSSFSDVSVGTKSNSCSGLFTVYCDGAVRVHRVGYFIAIFFDKRENRSSSYKFADGAVGVTCGGYFVAIFFDDRENRSPSLE